VGTQVFVPGGTTIEVEELIVNRFINALNYLGFSEPCRSYALQVFCASWIRPCFQIETGARHMGNVRGVTPNYPSNLLLSSLVNSQRYSDVTCSAGTMLERLRTLL